MSRARLRRTAAWTGVTLVAALVPLVVTAGPGMAEPGCTSEPAPATPTVPPSLGCDDTTPPDTVIATMTPAPNAAGFTREGSASFTFHEVVGDGDPGPWTFRCRLTGPGREAAVFESCQSGVTYTGLADTSGTPYAFEVYAVDQPDAAYTYLGNPLDPADDEPATAPDDDSASPAVAGWQQDTVAPSTVLTGGPADPQGTGSPILTTPQTRFTLGSDEAGTGFRCDLDGTDVPCAEGAVALVGLTGGDKTFAARAVDAAGNEGGIVTRSFTVPYDLLAARHWRLVSATGSFGGRVLTTRRPGSRVTLAVRDAREVRLLAPTNPRLGRIRVRVASGPWRRIDLGQGRARQVTFLLRPAQSAPVSGRVVIEALTRRPVRVDAIVLPRG